MGADAGGQRICLFGGTFDPIHNAHVRIAKEATAGFNLDRVLFVPAGRPPHKELSQIAPYEHRYRMVELVCKGVPKWEASRLEEGNQASYSINTVERLRTTLAPTDRLFFLIGSDAFDEIKTWHRWQELVRTVEFIVVSRPGATVRVLPGARVHTLNQLALPVSSTSIRDRLIKGEPTPELPDVVRQYIDAHHLYESGS
jgi:nicotinate-nucleotide adenylyltransferase